MENKQRIQEALEELLNKKKEGPVESILDEYLCSIAKTGITEFPWSQLKPLVSLKMDLMVDDFHAKQPCKQGAVCPNVESVTFDEMKKRLHTYLDVFNGVPFTIQRVCELLISKKVFTQYKNADKYMRGLEKNLMIVTTVDPLGRRIVSEPKTTNGLIHEGVKADSGILNSTPKAEGMKEGSPRKSTASWFSCLSDVVESPNSYPTWNHSTKTETSSPLSSQFKRMGNGDLKDPDSNIIFSSKFKSLSTEDDFEPVSKAIKLDEEAMKEEELKKNAERQQSTPLLSELLNSSSGTVTQASTHLTVVCSPSQDKKSTIAEKKSATSERKSPILATSTHQSEGVPTNVVHPLQKSETSDQMADCGKDEVEMKATQECSREESPVKEEDPVVEGSPVKLDTETRAEGENTNPVEKNAEETKSERQEDENKMEEEDSKFENECSEGNKLNSPPLITEQTNVV